MERSTLRKLSGLLALLLGLWAAVEYVLPLTLPFLLGALLAIGAEPLVRLSGRHLKLPRPLASGVGVTLTLLLFGTVLFILGALLVREVVELVQDLPDIRQTAASGTQLLEGWLLQLSHKTPKSIQPVLTGTVQAAFDDTSALMGKLSQKATGAVTGTLSRVPKVALTIGTGILAGFMISARLPRLKAGLRRRIPQSWQEKYIPALRNMKTALSGWLKAELKLAGITWVIVSIGLLLLRVPYGIFWAALIALVDAVPVLGTGTVLIPWAVIQFLQHNTTQGIGLLIIYGIAMLSRTLLEPRLVGRQIGLDPLWTLVAFYVGFTLWGVGGMLFAPVLATAVKAVVKTEK